MTNSMSTLKREVKSKKEDLCGFGRVRDRKFKAQNGNWI